MGRSKANVDHVALQAIGLERCWKCDRNRPLTDFYVSKHTAHGYSAICRECTRSKNAANSANGYQRNAILKSSYGIDSKDYAAIHHFQGGLCAICKKPERHQSKSGNILLSVDHEAGTKNVRGLLCRECNPAIGLLKHDPKILRAALAYVENGGIW